MPSESAEPLPHYLKPRLLSIILVVALLALTGFMLVSRYAQMDHARDLRTWQDKLNLIADSRATVASEWVGGHFRELKKLAENPSLQIYFAELRQMHPEGETMAAPHPAEPAQKSYLRNLLMFTADRMGFAPASVPLSLQIPTQIPYEAPSGIAVLDAENNIVVSTPYLSDLELQVKSQLAMLPADTPALIDMFRGSGGTVKIGFVVPVYGIQSDPGNAVPIARIIGLKEVNESLFSLLKHPGLTEKTLETILVRREGDNVVYLSPLADGAQPLEKTLAQNPETLAEAFAAAHPGDFAERRDYESRRTLVTGRAIPETPWTLVAKVDYSEAMVEGQVRRSGMVAILILIIGVVVLTVFAVWYGASSRRALMSTRYFKETAERSRAQEKLLRLVTDNQPESVFILDKDGHYRFANRRAARHAHMEPEDMAGKPINDVLGTAKAEDILNTAEAALYNKHEQSRIRRHNDDGKEIIIRSEYVPIEHIPVSGLPDKTPGVLVVEQDISEVVHERERRLRLHRQLIDTLIAIVDRRDPHAANHSMLVSQIAYEVAQGMGLDDEMCETTRIAGSLMNIGKIVVSSQVLTKRESLSEEEKQAVRDSMHHSADLLKGISFEGPVVETLEQMQERWDGSGSNGLKEDGILVSARIIAAVNAFVGMISPRSYRAAMTVDAAIKALLEKVDTLYDRRAVVALANYMDNLGGRAALELLRAA